MRLLELIPTPEADRALIDVVSHFCDLRLGKGVVLAKDTPNFIANRIGTFSSAQRHAPDAGSWTSPSKTSMPSPDRLSAGPSPRPSARLTS